MLAFSTSSISFWTPPLVSQKPHYTLNLIDRLLIGVGIIYCVLHATTHLLTVKCHLKGFETGVYGTPPRISYWLRQSAVYMFALTIMKLVVVALFAALPIIFDAGEWLLGFLGASDAAQVILSVSHHPYCCALG